MPTSLLTRYTILSTSFVNNFSAVISLKFSTLAEIKTKLMYKFCIQYAPLTGDHAFQVFFALVDASGVRDAEERLRAHVNGELSIYASYLIETIVPNASNPG